MDLILETYKKKCKTTLGGIRNFYLAPFVKYNRSQIKTSGMFLTQFPRTNLFRFDSIGSYNQSSEEEEGATFFNQSINIQLSEVYNVLDAHIFLNRDFRVVVETNNNEFLMFGVFNGLGCKISNSSGSNKNEFNGFNFDFTGLEEKTALKINNLTELGFTIVGSGTPYNFVFEDGKNFNFQDNNNYIF